MVYTTQNNSVSGLCPSFLPGNNYKTSSLVKIQKPSDTGGHKPMSQNYHHYAELFLSARET
jgi:hypothetical protein